MPPDAPAVPVRITTPACGAVTAVVPTATHGPAVHETASRSADAAVTGAAAHLLPPLAVVRTTPWPVRAPPSTVAVVPTAVQEAPVPVAVLVVSVPGVQSMPWSAPVPTGTFWGAQVAPPSDVTSMAPITWPTSTDWAAVAQQWVASVHDSAVATDAGAGSRPVATQVPACDGVRVLTTPETTPNAVHRPSTRQSTAVTSVVPGGTTWRAQVVPLVVVRMAPGPTPVTPTWPTAGQERAEVQATPER